MLGFFIIMVAMVFFIISGLLIFYGINLYNRMVRVKHDVKKSWANIDVLLHQLHAELPKLVDMCRQHTRFEVGTLERVIQARSEATAAHQKYDIAALGRAENRLHTGLGQLFALAEQYPTLKGSESFMQLHQRISGLEESIAERRELYNEVVNYNNALIEQFPDLIIAKIFHFGAAPLLTFTEEQTSDVDIDKLFNK